MDNQTIKDRVSDKVYFAVKRTIYVLQVSIENSFRNELSIMASNI